MYLIKGVEHAYSLINQLIHSQEFFNLAAGHIHENNETSAALKNMLTKRVYETMCDTMKEFDETGIRCEFVLNEMKSVSIWEATSYVWSDSKEDDQCLLAHQIAEAKKQEQVATTAFN